MHGLRLSLALFFALTAGCGGSGYDGGSPTTPNNPSGGGGGGGSSNTNAITVADNNFRPAATTVPSNTTVTWTWTGREQHNVTFNDGAASATQSSGSFRRTFTQAGSYPYECTIHGSAMSGVVTVQ